MNRKKQLVRMKMRGKEAKKTSHNGTFNKIMASAGQHNCPVCGPWEGENKVTRTPKHGSKKPKYKDKIKKKGEF